MKKFLLKNYLEIFILMILIKVLEVLRLPQGESIKRETNPEIRTQAILKLGKKKKNCVGNREDSTEVECKLEKHRPWGKWQKTILSKKLSMLRIVNITRCLCKREPCIFHLMAQVIFVYQL